MIRIVNLREKSIDCKYIENKMCSFNGAVLCKDQLWGNPAECILYQLIENDKKLEEKVRRLELSVNGVSTATTTTRQ